MQNSDFRTRIASLYVSQPSSFFCAFTTARLLPELIVSIGPSYHLWFLSCKTATLGPELQVSKGPRPRRWSFAFKTASLAPELQVSMGPNPHLRGAGTRPAGPATARPMFTPSLRHDDVTLAIHDVIET